MKTGPVENHRSREEGVTVYPVISRRSEGLSIGINLWTESKVCTFNCPYCEVFDFNHDVPFLQTAMKSGLLKTIAWAKKDKYQIKDLCFSGNGEPTISPNFLQALNDAIEIRANEAPEADIVVITNGTGLLQKNIFDALVKASLPPENITLWLKLDAGTENWYKKINACDIPFVKLLAAIKEFTAAAPFIFQTIHCSVNGQEAPEEELDAWLRLVTEIAGKGKLKAVHIYGKARPSPHDPVCKQLPLKTLEHRAGMLEIMFHEAGLKGIKIGIFE